MFEDIPQGGHTNGKDEADAIRHAPEALKAAISLLMEKGFGVPLPSKPKGRKAQLIGLPSVVDDAKVELYIAMRVAGIRKADLARRMGVHKQQVERLLDLDHTSRIGQIEDAFAAIGKRLLVAVADAA
jgi:antitoxin HicB